MKRTEEEEEEEEKEEEAQSKKVLHRPMPSITTAKMRTGMIMMVMTLTTSESRC